MRQTLADLRTLYDSELAPTLVEIQEAREDVKRRALNLSMILFLVLAILFYGFTHSILLLAVAAALAAVVALIYYSVGKKKQTNRFKDFVIQKVLNLVAPEMTYDREDYVSKEQFKKSGIYTASLSSYDGEDCFSGKFEGIDLIFSEVHAQEKVSSSNGKGGRTTSYRTIFKGVFFIADFHKDFRSSTLVIPMAAERVFGRSIGRLMKKLNFSHRGLLTRMECPEFEKMFAVYAQDAIEARYILTPNIMERMIAIQRRFPGNVAFAFHDSEIYIAIPLNADFFEPSRQLDFACVTALYEQLRLFLDLVHDLNLTLRIWTKT